MLVVDVPEGALAQHPVHVGDLRKRRGAGRPAYRPKEPPREFGHVGHVLEQVAAEHQIAGQVGVPGPVPIPDEAQRHAIDVTVGEESRVDPDAFGDAALGEQLQKVSLSASHLEHPSPGEAVALDQLVGKALGKALELGRERLALLGGLGVVDQPGVE